MLISHMFHEFIHGIFIQISSPASHIEIIEIMNWNDRHRYQTEWKFRSYVMIHKHQRRAVSRAVNVMSTLVTLIIHVLHAYAAKIILYVESAVATDHLNNICAVIVRSCNNEFRAVTLLSASERSFAEQFQLHTMNGQSRRKNSARTMKFASHANAIAYSNKLARPSQTVGTSAACGKSRTCRKNSCAVVITTKWVLLIIHFCKFLCDFLCARFMHLSTAGLLNVSLSNDEQWLVVGESSANSRKSPKLFWASFLRDVGLFALTFVYFRIHLIVWKIPEPNKFHWREKRWFPVAILKSIAKSSASVRQLNW